MKKLTALMLALLMMASMLASCGGEGLDGKTFAYDSFKLEWENDEAKAMAEAMGMDEESLAGEMVDEFVDFSIRFEDGKAYGTFGDEEEDEAVKYTQNGDDITIEGMDDMGKIYLDGGKLVIEASMENMFTIKIFFVEK